MWAWKQLWQIWRDYNTLYKLTQLDKSRSFRVTNLFFFFPGMQVYSHKYAIPGLALVGTRMDNAAFNVFWLCSWAALSVLYCGVHRKDTALGEGMMIMQKVIWECQVSYAVWDSGVMEKSFPYRLPLLFAICSVVSTPRWSGRSGDELPVAVSHLMGLKSCFSLTLVWSL